MKVQVASHQDEFEEELQQEDYKDEGSNHGEEDKTHEGEGDEQCKDIDPQEDEPEDHPEDYQLGIEDGEVIEDDNRNQLEQQHKLQQQVEKLHQLNEELDYDEEEPAEPHYAPEVHTYSAPSPDQDCIHHKEIQTDLHFPCKLCHC